MIEVAFTLNGSPRTVSVRPDENLLDTLRERCSVLSTKNGCQPQGQCGCCTVIIDGQAKTACVVPTAKVAGKEVLTMEGVSEQERTWLADAFIATTGLQCGFCTPGIALRAKHLLDRDPNPSREAIAKAIDVNLCRCTGYNAVLDAVELAGKSWRGELTAKAPYDGGVGAPIAKVDGRAMVLGERPFVDDLRFPGLLAGAVVLSEHPHARVLAIDTSAAKALPGVHAVLTAADVPGQRWQGLIYNDWPELVAIGEEVRYVGDVVAIVAADDAHTARQAAELVKVDYEVLPALLDRFEALEPGAQQVNPKGPNKLSETTFTRGDVDAALAASAHVVSETFETQRIEHLFLEPESALARPTLDGGLHLYSGGQGVFDDRRQIASYLNIPEEKLFVELVPAGGGFGGKEDMSVQSHACLLALHTGRPVRVTLTREQSVRMHPKRHPMHMRFEVGCDAVGKLTAVRAFVVGDTGPYASVGGKVLERAAGHACGPYAVTNVHISAIAARTNNPPCGAMRGFGANQTAFAMEGCLDRLAEKLGMDGWELRFLNAVQIGDTLATGQILEKSVGVRATLLAAKPFYDEAKAKGRAVGIACGIKNSGLGNGAKEWGKVRMVVRDDGRVDVFTGFTEMGQGLYNVMTQCASEVTGLPSTTFVPGVNARFDLAVGQTTGSRATLLAGNATIRAAQALLADLKEHDLADLAGRVYAGDILIADTQAPDSGVPNPKVHTAYGYATQLCILDEQGRVERFVAAHDVGRAINPELCKGQIVGAVHMGLGFALTEELPCKDGMPVTVKLREIGVLRAQDMPPVDVILVEEHEPEGPFGAKGVGEIGLVPTAGAVAGAVAAFDGVRRTKLPMKDTPAAKAMSVGRIRTKDMTDWK